MYFMNQSESEMQVLVYPIHKSLKFEILQKIAYN